MAIKVAGESSAAEKADLISELTEVKGNLDKLIRSYEKTFGESYTNSAVPVGAPSASSAGASAAHHHSTNDASRRVNFPSTT